MIIAKSVSKSFGQFKAVEDLSLHIKKGECFGLLGPNGAGKSTFINMIYGATLRTGGDLKVLGMDPHLQSREIKKRIGVVTQENALDESLTVIENMMIYAAFIGVPKSERSQRVDSLLSYMNLSHKKSERIQTLSGGMKRRLVFVRALLGKPDLVILDEPTTGLDPAVRHLLWGRIKELKQEGTTVILTTHYMHEAEVLCDRLVIVNQGRVVAEGSPTEMIKTHTPGYVGIYNHERKNQIQGLVGSHNEYGFLEDNSGVYVRAKQIEQLIDLNKKHNLEALQIRPANLEDVFLKLTGQELSSDA